MNLNIPISQIMTSDVRTVKRTADLRHVNTLMKEKNIRHLPVVDGERLVGIVSRTDIMRLSFGDIYDNQSGADETMFDMLSLDQVMVHKPVSVRHDTTLRDVALKLASSDYHAFPVTDEEKVVGIITTTDIIRYLISGME
ncbi:MAG: CBS domain-containing protein [Saprospiraceae bacterium]|nr:CBS domain-containing protein [Saprospiraceae bacterium]